MWSRDFARGLDWYRKQFQGPENTLFVDATPAYSALPIACPPAPPPATDDPRAHVVARLKELRPDARFIYVLRDPVARTYSAYWHFVRNGSERRGFREAILGNSIYLRSSYYAGQLRAYLEAFSLTAFHVVTFEDLRDDPAAVATSCFRFLGLEPVAISKQQEEAKNVSFTYAKGLAAAGALFGGPKGLERLLRAASTLTPRRLKPFAARLVTNPIPPLGDDDRKFLVEIFRERNRELEALLGRSFPRWQGR